MKASSKAGGADDHPSTAFDEVPQTYQPMRPTPMPSVLPKTFTKADGTSAAAPPSASGGVAGKLTPSAPPAKLHQLADGAMEHEANGVTGPKQIPGKTKG